MTFDPYHVTNHSPSSRANYTSPCGAKNPYHYGQSHLQGVPSPHPERAPPLRLSAHTPVPVSRLPTPVPPKQFATDPAITAGTSISLQYGRAPTLQASGTARVTRSFPTLPEASNPAPCLIPVPNIDFYHRSTALHADGESTFQAHDIRDLVRCLISHLVYGARLTLLSLASPPISNPKSQSVISCR